jgi:hypothetical protein
MHSRHATTATQEELDALANKSSLCSLTMVPTAAAQPTPKTSAEPTPKTSTEPDALLPDAPAAAPVATEEWRIATGKGTRGRANRAETDKRRTATLHDKTPNDKRWTATPRDKTPNDKPGRQGKKAH